MNNHYAIAHAEEERESRHDDDDDDCGEDGDECGEGKICVLEGIINRCIESNTQYDNKNDAV